MAKLLTEPIALRVAELPQNATLPFTITLDADQRAALAEELGILELRKLGFQGSLAPLGSRDWQLNAELGATVVQACIITLEPVTSRIDQPVRRRFLSTMPRFEDLAPTPEDGVEMPEDDSEEPLGEVIDLAAILAEALALALPDYPRKDMAEPLITTATPPDAEPLTDSDLKPFAGLAALKSRLQGGE